MLSSLVGVLAFIDSANVKESLTTNEKVNPILVAVPLPTTWQVHVVLIMPWTVSVLEGYSPCESSAGRTFLDVGLQQV